MNLKKEDSTVFLEEIEKLKKGKKKKKNNENTANEEDYDDEILDENVSSVKTEQIQHISGNVDFNQNNLLNLSKKLILSMRRITIKSRASIAQIKKWI